MRPKSVPLTSHGIHVGRPRPKPVRRAKQSGIQATSMTSPVHSFSLPNAAWNLARAGSAVQCMG